MEQVLIVDDTAFNRKVFRRALERGGVDGNILTAGNEEEARRIIEEEEVLENGDCVILLSERG